MKENFAEMPIETALLPKNEREKLREAVKTRTQQKIAAIIFAGAIAAGFFAPKAGQESYEGMYKQQPAAEVTTPIKGHQVSPEKKIEKKVTTEQKVELERLDKLIAELDVKVNKYGKLMKTVGELRKTRETFATIVNQKPKESAKEPLRVSNFEKVGTNNKILADLVEKTYPFSWKQHVRSVAFIDAEVAGSGEGLITCASSFYNHQSVEFYRGFERCGGVEKIMGHELAHMVDWDRNESLSVKEKLEFLQKVLSRVESQDRFVDSRVENIKYDDKKLTNRMKAAEYWGYLMEKYLEHPHSAGNFSKADLELIKWFFEKTDPDFDAKEALNKRLAYTTASIDENGRVSEPRLLAKAEYGTINKAEY